MFVAPLYNLKMKAEKIVHRNELRIKIDFPYKTEFIQKIKQIQDAKWSKTQSCWHIPYTKESFDHLIKLFPDIEISGKNESKAPENEKTITPPKTIAKKQLATSPKVHLQITPTRIFVKLPKNETDILFLKSFKYVRWDNIHFHWIIPNSGRNLTLITKYFSSRDVEIEEQELIRFDVTEKPLYTDKQMVVINHHNRNLRLYYTFNNVLNIAIKQLPLCHWNGTDGCWSTPFSEKSIETLRSIASENELEFVYKQISHTKGKPRISRFDIKNYRKCPESYLAKLRELRYSQNTINTYSDMFEEFINYFSEKNLEDITEDEIIQFIRYLVTERCVSTSYQNQSINSIKFYYERVLGQKRKIYLIERPREEKYLPEVLSSEEIVKILAATENLKHKAILMTIYSGGLRIGELVNLKIKDIDSKRMQIRVEQAKGKKDRYTLLSKKALDTLREYFAVYKPRIWLFEGDNGGQYSMRSIQNILRKAVRKVGITKRVTVHTLRHSFATHLLESGTDIRYIQSLLGHGSSKTTEIYTHITTKGFDKIKNPLDDLEFS